MEIKYGTTLYKIRKWLRAKDFFKYWTKYRRKEENCCTKCGSYIGKYK